MNLESCRSLNLWSQFFDFARKTQLCDRTVETGHHIAERKTVDFTVRVPAGEVTPETLAQVEVVLLRVKRGITVDRLDDESVSKRFERELRPVARLSGLPNEALPDAVRARGQPTRPR